MRNAMTQRYHTKYFNLTPFSNKQYILTILSSLLGFVYDKVISRKRSKQSSTRQSVQTVDAAAFWEHNLYTELSQLGNNCSPLIFTYGFIILSANNIKKRNC